MLKVQSEAGNNVCLNLMGSKKTNITRARTETEKRMRNLQKYQLQPPCSSQCRRKCTESSNEVHRLDILTNYWSLTFVKRREWLDRHIQLGSVARRRNNSTGEPKRNHSLLFFLPLPDGGIGQVCKRMFLSTIGLRSDSIITQFVKAKNRDETANITTEKVFLCSIYLIYPVFYIWLIKLACYIIHVQRKFKSVNPQ